MITRTHPHPFRCLARPALLAVALVAVQVHAQDPTPAATDEPGAVWAPAAATNFAPANRPTERPIDYVVIHDIEGPAESAVRWFQNPMAKVSAHYVVAGGRVWQQVREHDVAWHAGNSDLNGRSVGIEHDGYAYRPGFFDAALYETSARLVRSVTTRYVIPRDRAHIIAHAEVPHPTDPAKFGGRSGHTDPGPFWDWDYYMSLVRGDSRFDVISTLKALHPGERMEVTVSAENRGDDPWPAPAGARPARADSTRDLIYLARAAGEPEPSGASPFYDPTTWVSPRYVAALAPGHDIAPVERGTFKFSVRAPRTLGEVRETLRLVKVPVAPHRPVPFGSTLELNLTVNPWIFELNSRSPRFDAPGWVPLEAAGESGLVRRFGHSAGEPAFPARWKASLPLDGIWLVQARWPKLKGAASRVVYDLSTGEQRLRRVIDYRKPPADWLTLGRIRATGAKPDLTITLAADDGSGGAVTTGSLRVIGPFDTP